MCLPGTLETVREDLEETGSVSRRALLAGGGAAAIAAAMPGVADARSVARRVKLAHLVDLTHTFSTGFPVASGPQPTRRTTLNLQQNGFYAQGWTFGEHTATHLDAPAHVVPGGRRVPQLRPRDLLVPAAVIDIRRRAASNPDTVVGLADVRAYERRHGRIPRGALVLMNSGWAARLGTPGAFSNKDAGGVHHFPGFGLEAVDWLLRRRAIKGLGVDTLSLDAGNSNTYPVHKRLLGAGRYGLESVANLSRLRPKGAVVSVGVVPWEEGSGGPCRLLAFG
jgi:kynurenine formamidase